MNHVIPNRFNGEESAVSQLICQTTGKADSSPLEAFGMTSRVAAEC